MARNGKKKRRRRLNNKDVSLSNCDAPVAYLNKPDDQARWNSGDGGSYAIAFYAGPHSSSPVSPFTATVFTVVPGIPTLSGSIKTNAPKGRYKYRVIGDRDCDHDPIIHIGP